MKIKTELLLFGILILGLIIIQGAVALSVQRSIDMAIEKNHITTQIVNGAFNLSTLNSDYLLNRGKRAETQWRLQHNRLSTQTTLYPVNNPSEQHIINEIEKQLDSTLIHFSQLINLVKEQSATVSAMPTGLKTQWRLSSQLPIDAQKIVSLTTELANLNRTQLFKTRQINSQVVFVTIVLLSASLVGMYFQLALSISRPIKELEEGVRMLTSGNLDFIFSHTSNDEFSLLGKSFNYMVRQLKTTRQQLYKQIKERTNQLEQVKHDKARDEAILFSVSDGLVVVDKDGKIIKVNRAFENMLGRKGSEAIGKNMVKIIPKEDEQGNRIAYHERILSQILKGKKPFLISTAYYYVKKDKTRFPVALTASPIIVKGHIIGAIETFRDITKEKEANVEKTQFVSLASHQLRTPLSTINWYSELLLSPKTGIMNIKQKDYAREIYKASCGAVKLVSALLDVSRIELGTFATEVKPTDIVQLAKNVVQEIHPQMVRKKLKFHQLYSPLPLIKMDSKLLNIIFQNLLLNALQYTPTGGKINLEIKKNKNTILIVVKDTGVGIPLSQQGRVFAKLFRADNVKNESAGGTGLGLYMVKTIIDHTGGKIRFTSLENKGTIFYISFPLKGMQHVKKTT